MVRFIVRVGLCISYWGMAGNVCATTSWIECGAEEILPVHMSEVNAELVDSTKKIRRRF